MCKCITLMDKHLAEHNTMLTKVSMLNMKTGKLRESLVIGSQRRDSRNKRSKPKVVLPTFCPFCGKRSAPKRAPRADQKSVRYPPLPAAMTSQHGQSK